MIYVADLLTALIMNREDYFLYSIISEEVSGALSGRLYHLEVMLKQLNNDLEKVSTPNIHTQLSHWLGLGVTVLIRSFFLSLPRRSRIRWLCWQRWLT